MQERLGGEASKGHTTPDYIVNASLASIQTLLACQEHWRNLEDGLERVHGSLCPSSQYGHIK